jgi:NAD(P)-dependent dehydrogenase (short-subunit alcohol dehydrogenase family)
MEEFKGKVAVITGAASGIGLALAHKAVAEGMKVVIADIRADALAEAEKSLRAAGGEVLAVPVDVTQYDQVEALANKAYEIYGAVHLLCNNAGFFATSVAWQTSVELFRWAIDENLMSVIHGIHAFVPRMIEQGDECQVVNVASSAGIMTNFGFCTYSMTKHAVVGLTEVLWHDLTSHGLERIGVTLVMPGFIQSDVMNPIKIAPNAAIRSELEKRLEDPLNDGFESMMRDGVAEGMPASEAAALIFQAVHENKLYVLPNNEVNTEIAINFATGRAIGKNGYAGEV